MSLTTVCEAPGAASALAMPVAPTEKFMRFVDAMKQQLAALAQGVQTYHIQIVQSRSRKREIEMLHRQQIAAITEAEVATSGQIEAVRQEMLDTTQRADARVAQELAAQAEELHAITQTGAARTEEIQRAIQALRRQTEVAREEAARQREIALAEKDAAVQEITHLGDAEIATLQREAAALRLEIERYKTLSTQHLAEENARQAKDTERMQYFCNRFTTLSMYHANPEHREWGLRETRDLQVIINVRRCNPITLEHLELNYHFQRHVATSQRERLARMVYAHTNASNKAEGVGLLVEFDAFLQARAARSDAEERIVPLQYLVDEDIITPAQRHAGRIDTRPYLLEAMQLRVRVLALRVASRERAIAPSETQALALEAYELRERLEQALGTT